MNFIRAILGRIAAEFRAQRLGRRALREVRFAKYKVAPEQSSRVVQERMLRRVPQNLKTASWKMMTSY